MRIAALVVVLALAAGTALAQPSTTPAARPPDVAAQREAIARVAWLVGDWEGAGWVDLPEGRQAFRQTEKVEARLGGALLVIEGHGYAGAPEALAFNALGLLSHDDRTGRYAFRSFTRGYYAEAAAEVRPDGALVWTMAPPGMTIRYTLSQPGPGQWREIGERSTDGGASWRQFFEMQLTRKP